MRMGVPTNTTTPPPKKNPHTSHTPDPFSGEGVEKQGVCPPLEEKSNCTQECHSDGDCADNLKCCPAGCANVCHLPNGNPGAARLGRGAAAVAGGWEAGAPDLEKRGAPRRPAAKWRPGGRDPALLCLAQCLKTKTPLKCRGGGTELPLPPLYSTPELPLAPLGCGSAKVVLAVSSLQAGAAGKKPGAREKSGV